MAAPVQPPAGLSAPFADGPWKGWSTWTGSEPFEEYAGPFYTREDQDGSRICGFRPRGVNLNGTGFVHGGAIATFADYSLFMIAHDAVKGETAVTVSLNTEFVGGARADSLLISRGNVLRSGKSLVFVRGVIEVENEPILNFSGVLRVFRAGGS